jgi:hypothetical protein
MVGCLKKREMSSGHQDIRDRTSDVPHARLCDQDAVARVQLTQNAEHAAQPTFTSRKYRAVLCRGLKMVV